MKFEELPEDEKRAARVYIRNRRKAWDHFFNLQDLKTGDYVATKKGIYQIVTTTEAYDATPLDIVVTARNVTDNKLALFGFSIRAHEAGLMYSLLRLHNKDRKPYDVNIIYDSFDQQLKIDEQARLIYDKV